MAGVGQKKARTGRRRFYHTAEEKKAARKEVNRRYLAKMVFIGFAVDNWERQKLLCGFSTNPEFADHLLTHHNGCCIPGDGSNRSEHGASVTQQDANIPTGKQSYDCDSEVATSEKGALQENIPNTEENMLEGIIDKAEAKELLLEIEALPEQSVHDTKDVSGEGSGEVDALPEGTVDEISALVEETSDEMKAVPEESTEEIDTESIHEIDDVAEESPDEIATLSDNTTDQMEIVPKLTTNKVNTQDQRLRCHWCKPCQRVFSDTEIKPHLLSHFKGKLVHCAQCIEGFANEQLVEEHVLKHMELKINQPQGQGVGMNHFVVSLNSQASKRRGVAQPSNHDSKLSKQKEDKDQGPIPHTKNFVSYHVSPELPPTVKNGGKELVIKPKLSFKCTMCGENSKSWQEAQKHSRVHDIETPYKCNMCTKYFNTQDKLSEHETDLCAKVIHKCKTCGKVFQKKQTLKNHEVVHRTISTQKWDKEESSKTSTSDLKTSTKLEMSEVKQTKPSSKKTTRNSKSCSELALPESAVKPVILSFKCTSCGEEFKSFRARRDHSLIHSEETPYRCSMCAKYFETEGKLTEHVNYLHQCSDCGKMLKNKQAHRCGQKGAESRFICEHCGKMYQQKIHLETHRYHHTGKWPFVCSVCDKGYPTQTTLDYHTAMHLNKRPFICQTCGKAFVRPGDMSIHQLSHLEERTFSCDVCSKSFRCERHLGQHKRASHADDRHSCSICGLTFTTKGALRLHTKRHNGVERKHKCSQCGKLFVHNCDLQRHLLTHSKERPHQCEVCGDAFQQKGHLVTHMMGHTGEWSHKCGLCGKGFGNPGHLAKHMASKHGST